MKIQSIKSQNYGLYILKFILSFFVVIVHCGIIENKFMKRIIVDLKFHVPTFMFMAFYFYSKHIISKDIAKIKQRFIRLFVPYIIWPILIFIFNNSFLSLIGKGQFKKYLTIQDLIQQLILGIKFHYVFWFQINIILLTFLFTIIYFCLNKNIQYLF